jgi:hypothetical protein
LLGQIDNGQYAGVKSDGVKIGQAGEFVQKMMSEQSKFTFTAYYIDSGASAEQRKALRKLFIGSSPHALGQPAEVKEIAIAFPASEFRSFRKFYEANNKIHFNKDRTRTFS